MPKGIITTRSIRQATDGRVELVAKLDAGEVLPLMFIHVPLNGMLDFTVRIQEVLPDLDGCLRLILAGGNDADGAKLVMAFFSEDDTLEVLETGED